MNAVERLLAHVEKIAALFDEMYREVDEQEHPDWLVGRPPAAFDELLRNYHFHIYGWWRVAMVAANYDDAQASEMLCERLERREKLLDHDTLHALVADVVRDCRAWDFLAEDVVRAAETVADNALEIERLSRGWNWRPTYEWQTRRDGYVLHNIGMLRRLAQPQADAGSTSAKRNNSPGKQKKRRDRKGVGGRKKKYADEFVRGVLAARSREEKACRRSKERLPSKAEWLRIYCRNRGIDIAKMFPSKDEAAPEPWDERANRFWKAVEARENRAGN